MRGTKLIVNFILLFSIPTSILILFFNPLIDTKINEKNYSVNFMNLSNKFDYRHWYILYQNSNDIYKKKIYIENIISLLKFNSPIRSKFILEKTKEKLF